MNSTYFGNTPEQYLWFAGILLAGILSRKIFAWLFSNLFFRILNKYSRELGFKAFLELLRKPFGGFVLFFCIYLAFSQLNYPESWHLAPGNTFGVRMVIARSFQVGIVMSLTWIILRMVDFAALVYRKKAEENESMARAQIIPFAKEAVKISIALLSLFFILGVIFELNIASLIAGLGIGGLAIALAAKESLENLLGSFTIFFDKPFAVGDLVETSGVKGHIERIGFRSTRIRTLDKSFVTVPNKKLTDSVLENITLKTMQRIRIVLLIPNDAGAEKIVSIKTEMLAYLQKNNKLTGERSIRFESIDPRGAFELLVICFAATQNADEAADIKEELQLALLNMLQNHQLKLFVPAHG
jgi:MscS family membrane protein